MILNENSSISMEPNTDSATIFIISSSSYLGIRFFVPKRRKIFVVIVKYLKIGIILIGHYSRISSEWNHEYSGIILNHSPWPKSDLDNQNTPQDSVFVISSVDNEFSTFSKLRRKFMVLSLAFSAFKAC